MINRAPNTYTATFEIDVNTGVVLTCDVIYEIDPGYHIPRSWSHPECHYPPEVIVHAVTVTSAVDEYGTRLPIDEVRMSDEAAEELIELIKLRHPFG